METYADFAKHIPVAIHRLSAMYWYLAGTCSFHMCTRGENILSVTLGQADNHICSPAEKELRELQSNKRLL